MIHFVLQSSKSERRIQVEERRRNFKKSLAGQASVVLWIVSGSSQEKDSMVIRVCKLAPTPLLSQMCPSHPSTSGTEKLLELEDKDRTFIWELDLVLQAFKMQIQMMLQIFRG